MLDATRIPFPWTRTHLRVDWLRTKPTRLPKSSPHNRLELHSDVPAKRITKRRLLQSTLFGSLALMMGSGLFSRKARAEGETLVQEVPSTKGPEGVKALEAGAEMPAGKTEVPKSYEMTPEDVDRLMRLEEERRKRQNGRGGRIRELEETQAELAQMQLELLQKEQELLERDQSLAVLREELELERRIRALLTKEKEQAVEEAALARGLCGGMNVMP